MTRAREVRFVVVVDDYDVALSIPTQASPNRSPAAAALGCIDLRIFCLSTCHSFVR